MFHKSLFQTCPLFIDGNTNEDVIETRPFGNDKMTCREIRRNSAGCIKLKEECEKCKEIQHIGKCNVRLNTNFAEHQPQDLEMMLGSFPQIVPDGGPWRDP